MSVVVVGANHRTASLDLLERMVVTEDRLPKLLHDLDSGSDVSEVAVLTTCNRTEVYLVAERFHSAYAQVRDFFADLTYLPPDLFADSLYVHYDDAAARHLFEVSAGLDSAVPGEHEILGQVRDAWELALREGTSRRSLNLLFRHAIEVGKRARTETGIARHVTSVSQAAVILAAEHLSGGAPAVDSLVAPDGSAVPGAGFDGRRVVLVGAGSMARGMASFLANSGVGELVVANRTVSRAEDLVESLGAASDSAATDSAGNASRPGMRAVGLDELEASIAAADVLFAATNAPDALLSVDQIAGALEGRDGELLIVDVGVPRDVDPAIATLDGVTVLDMEDVASMTEANLAARRAEADAVRRIVDQELGRFEALSSAREAAPVIAELRGRAEEIRAAELLRYANRLDGLDDEQRAAVEAVTKGIVAKLLHTPTIRLKDAAGTGRGDRLSESLRDLFDLG